MGYKRIVLKSDQEPAIKTLKEAVKRAWDGEIVMEESPVAEHQSNGRVERAVQTIQGMVRTFRDALESRYGIRLTGKDNVIPWMVMHAACVISNFAVGKDGRTAVERLKGKIFSKPQLEFGECVTFLRPKTLGKDKADQRWDKGVYFGMGKNIGVLCGYAGRCHKGRDPEEIQQQRGKLEFGKVQILQRNTLGTSAWQTWHGSEVERGDPENRGTPGAG